MIAVRLSSYVRRYIFQNAEGYVSKFVAAQPIVCRHAFDYTRRRCGVPRGWDVLYILLVGGYVLVLSRMQVVSTCEYVRVAAKSSRHVVRVRVL